MTDDANPVRTYSAPPMTFTDKEGRRISVESFDGHHESLASMYAGFDASDRAQGLPPVREARIESWLDTLAEGIGVVASHGDCAVGHATLLKCSDGTHELTIFVAQAYQLAGIGSKLMACLLGAGQQAGAERVWLSVQRSNHVAMNLYRKFGFETVQGTGLEHEMELAMPQN